MPKPPRIETWCDVPPAIRSGCTSSGTPTTNLGAQRATLGIAEQRRVFITAIGYGLRRIDDGASRSGRMS